MKRRLPKARIVTEHEKPYTESELAFLEFMKGKTSEDLIPEKIKREHEDYKRAKRAGLIP